MTLRAKSRDSKLASAKCLVIKVGSALLADERTGDVRKKWLQALADDVAKAQKHGQSVVLVSSGAIAVGRQHLKLRAGKLRCLLVTDLAARGLDVPECDAVFNLELPSDGVHYAHRAGRTARAGREGMVVTLVEPREQFVLGKIERQLGLSAGTIAESKLGGGVMMDVAEVNSRILQAKTASAVRD